MTALSVAPCSLEAARFAVMNWHYSQAMPAGKLVRYGVWENRRFIGCVLYGHGANNKLGKPYNLDITECVELVRIAMTDHASRVTQIVSRTLADLRVINPRLRLVVSFADPEHNHHGGIYQAGNWTYAGVSGVADEYLINGKRLHGRSVRARRNSSRTPRETNTLEWAQRQLDPNTKKISGSSKHRYLYPLDRAMRRKISKLSLPYPQPCGGSIEGDTSPSPGESASSTLAHRSTR